MSFAVDDEGLTILFDEPLVDAAVETSIFEVTLNGSTVEIVSARSTGSAVTASLATRAYSDDQVEAAYSAGAAAELGLELRDASGEPSGDFRSTTVENHSAAGCSQRLLGSARGGVHEGLVDSDWNLRALGELRVALVFVDFADAPGVDSGEALASRLGLATGIFASASVGRLSVRLSPSPGWIRMPRASVDYGIQRAPWGIVGDVNGLVRDAVTGADAFVDYRAVDALAVVAARGTRIPASFASLRPRGSGLTTGEGLLYHVVFLDPFWLDERVPSAYGPLVFVHELAHLLGLPDLYDLAGDGWDTYRWAGGWDLMSRPYLNGGFLAWHRWKLGWLDPSQLRCVRSGTLEATLAPLGVPGGLKAVIVPTGSSTAIVVENRQRLGDDVGICDTGVLVYSVDSTVWSGTGPVQVRAARAGTDSEMRTRCGPLYDGLFDVGPGELSRLEDTSATVEVLERLFDGSMRVRVTRR